LATKWKNRILLALWVFLVTVGLSGLFTIVSFAGRYVHRDYFQSPQFHSQLEAFAGRLSLIELMETTPEEAKQAITVTREEIEEHRYRYGDLHEQIANIKGQYQSRIEEAMNTNNEAAAAAYTAERDEKIADITKNFESDEHVRQKIVKEKEQKIDAFFKEREHFPTDFLKENESFKYYFKDSSTGKVYTNLNLAEGDSVKDYLNKKNMLYVTSYSIPKDFFLYNSIQGYEELAESLVPDRTGAFEGQIAVPKTLASINPIMIDYKNYQKMQKLLLIVLIATVISLVTAAVIVKKRKAAFIGMGAWGSYYSKVPLDIRIMLLGTVFSVSILLLFFVNDQFDYIQEDPVVFVGELALRLAVASVGWGFLLVQMKWLIPTLKSWQNVKSQCEKALVTKIWRRLMRLTHQAWNGVKDAFVIQSVGFQLFILFAVVFLASFGLAAFSLAANLSVLHYYLFLLVFIGFPLFAFTLKFATYFNSIVQKTNELTAGHLGPDLPVKGKSVLAKLALNINTLKQGVKTSQNEQAKSERLKTELITNVSHDLRTPLTSIISYTELLKNGDLTDEERAAYLEIIDRKSKRLKVLIDDLFEVSKMASGNIELKKEKVDLVQLLQQALAEYDDKIEASGLQFRVSHSEKPIYAIVDGQRLWRVFDNLINNILKYSLEHTRVYISIVKKNGWAEIVFKNVSKFELGENSDELFERFKRGDTSRHTEGSGLGLAIAKSIVDLHDGNLDIHVDGDLFKVIITLKLVE
jgi:signal transduction histidine kinase